MPASRTSARAYAENAVAFCALACCALALACAFSSCRGEASRFSTWSSLGNGPAPRSAIPVESLPPPDAFPWAGTVSHHLLADAEIDRWFAELAERRDVSVFYVLSPSHWGTSSQEFSVTDGEWLVSGGVVRSDRARARALASALGVPLENGVFDGEHGVSTLMPYVARYFPRAKIVALAYRGEPPLDQPMAERLLAALSPRFDARGKAENFLLISTDCAHHANLAGTEFKDARTRKFFDAPSPDTWIFAGCDNRPGIYALAYLLGSETRCSVLFHTNSLELSGQGADDITSYFFTYFWEEPGFRQGAAAATASASDKT